MPEYDDDIMEAIHKGLLFSKAARAVCKKAGVTYDFKCPICGGEASVCKSEYNGHHHAHCSGCGIGFME